MRRDEPNRHGRAADALIASYLRELVADEPAEPARHELAREAEAPPALLAAPRDELRLDASA